MNLSCQNKYKAKKSKVPVQVQTTKQIQNRNVQNRNVQNSNDCQQLFLAKCLVEQQLESHSRNTQLSIKSVNGITQFKTLAKKIAAVTSNGNLYVFAKPVVSFKGLPLDSTMIPLHRIEKIDGVMRCVKCREWVTRENITQCPCGGYLKARKRFQVMGQVTESLDDEYLEVQAALEDMQISARIDRTPRVKIPIPTGIITPKMAGMSSVSSENDATTHVGFLTAVHVKSNGVTLKDEEKCQYFKELGVDVESIQNKEIREWVRLGIRERAKIAVTKWDSGNNTLPRDAPHPINEKRKQHHCNTTPNSYNSSVPTRVRKTRGGNKPAKNVTCNSCHKEVTALVGPTCRDCFLRGSIN